MSELGAAWALEWMKRTRERVGEQRERLIDLDRQIGDGDHGENLDRGFGAVVDALGAQDPQTVADVLKLVAKTLMSTVGGAAGPLYGTAFLRGAKAAGAGGLDGAGAAGVVEAALGGIQARGKAVEGEKTMVDAWSPAARAARSAAEAGAGPAAVLEAAAAAARRGRRGDGADARHEGPRLVLGGAVDRALGSGGRVLRAHPRRGRCGGARGGGQRGRGARRGAPR